ncbi:MAG: D-2-hydroxyacid dehydrogenase [Chloroflexi bacterium]|nr:D-2-hydroxyacid dehydrogenase [Chloroflexota bacterium]
MTDTPIQVVVAMDFDDALIEQLRAISPRLQVERHFPTVPERVWANAEVLYTLRTFPLPEQAPRLRWIQMHTAGIDHVAQVPIVQAEDVDLTTASGIHAVQMAEYCIAMMLAFNYQLPKMLAFQARAEWPQNPYAIFAPRELRDQTLGIVGYGSIGRELARQADALGMAVLATKRNAMRPADDNVYGAAGTGDPEGNIPKRLYPPEALTSMVRECDFLVLTIPLTETTRSLINAAVLAAMKPTAVLINVARGGVVDEAALISALAANRIAGAALDVFDAEPLPSTSPLWNLNNVIISPHISGSSNRYHAKVAALFAENLTRYLDNRPLLNLVRREFGY